MFLQDIKYALRFLRGNGGFALAIVVCLALGMGATTAVFSVFHTALIKPLPMADAERLVMLYDTKRSPDGTVRNYRVCPPNFDAWRRQNEVFEDLTAIRQWDITLTGKGEPELVWAGKVMANFFSTLGLEPPSLGRALNDGEDRVGEAERVVLLNHELWQRRYGGDPSILGESVVLDGEGFTVIGVMPPGFGFPEGLEGENLPPRKLWMPLGLDPEREPDRRWHDLFVIGRLRPGVTLEEAQSHMETIAERLAGERPESNSGWGVRLVPLRSAMVGKEVRSALWLLLVGVGALLFIACTNVAGMLLARATTRGSEVALRISLGAGTGRLFRLVLTESVLLSLMGAAAGLLLARLSISPLVALSGVTLRGFQDVEIDLTVLGFTMAVAVATGILFGLAPAGNLLSTDLRQVLLEGNARGGTGRWGRRFQSGLVIGEIALILSLLVGTGVMLRNFEQLRRTDPGFETENLLTMRTTVAGTRYVDYFTQGVGFFDRVLEKVRAIPGVEAATVTSVLPIGDLEAAAIFTVRGRTPEDPNEMLMANHRRVGSEFFKTLGLPIIEGRPLDASDRPDSTPVVVISRHMAEQYWPGQSAVGRQIKRFGPASNGQPWMTIVGIAEDVRDTRLDGEVGDTWYLPNTQHVNRALHVVVRTVHDPRSFIPAVRQAIWSVDPDQPIYDVSTVAERVAGSLSKERFSTVLLSSFAAVGLILAVLGIYGAMSYWVRQRSTEIGICMALGAQARGIRTMILRQGVVLTVSGLALGVLLSLMVDRLFDSLFFEGASTDPLTVAAIALFLAAVALLAAYVPAYQATRVDPAAVLKTL